MRTSVSSGRVATGVTRANVIVRAAAALALTSGFLTTARPVFAVIDGCVLEEVVTAKATDSVLVKVHVQPDQRVNVILGQPEGVVIYTERAGRTDASGRLTLRFELGRLGYDTGVPLVVTAITDDDECEPAILRVVAGMLPDTAAAIPSDATPASSSDATWLAILSGATVAWLSRRRWVRAS
jgi:hypothetical protein